MGRVFDPVRDRVEADRSSFRGAGRGTITVNSDTGATGLSMPRSVRESLGLDFRRTRKSISNAGPIEVRGFGTVRLTVQGRDCPLDVTELPDGCPTLIGPIPLEAMDFVVEMASKRLIGNPAHGGDHVIELY